MTNYEPQVTRAHYNARYRDQERWLSYYHQLALIHELSVKTVLEVGPGEGIVTDVLRKDGLSVTTCDIAEDTAPDHVCSVTALPFADHAFDAALAAEVLEHVSYEDAAVALRELSRVARTHVVLSLPHPGWVFLLSLKVPLMKKMRFFAQIPFFWQEHRFNGEHYWELGKRRYSVSNFIGLAERAGLVLKKTIKYPDDPAHRFFVFAKKT